MPLVVASYPAWLRFVARRSLLPILMVGLLVAPAAAQLSGDDIEKLRQRGAAEGWTFTVGENPATQYTMEQLCGVVVPDNWREGARFDPCYPTRDLPTYFDWRDTDAVTGVRNQGGCGSCWAFALIGAVEGNIAIVDDNHVDLSEQWLVSCCGLGGCSGEWPGTAANFLLESGGYYDFCGDNGAVLESEYPYVASDSSCSCPFPHMYWLDTWAFVGPEWGTPTVDQLKQAILDHGPLCVCVTVNDAFQGYTGGIFNGCLDEPINHAVVLTGWDDSQGSNGVWFMKNSWGAGWGEGGYMRIEYNCSRIGFNALYVAFGGSPTLSFSFPEGKPTVASPYGTTFPVRITCNDGALVADSPIVRWRADGGVFQIYPMQHLGGDLYEASLPAAFCYSRLDWFLRAEEEVMGYQYDPPGAPAALYTSLVASATVVELADDFESDHGWTVAAGADTGNWERADPEFVQVDDLVSQPEDDHSADGTRCFVTGAAAGTGVGDFDVDGGPSHLVSPAFDLEGSDALVSYWRWYHISTQIDDELVVAISADDGATWTPVETITQRTEWTRASWRVGEYVAPSSQVRVRFTVDDSPNNSLVEALIDDFTIERLICSTVGDLNCDARVDFGDINPFVLALSSPAAYEVAYPDCDRLLADVNEDGVVDFKDINAFVVLLSS